MVDLSFYSFCSTIRQYSYVFFLHLPDKHQMPYLHYEKRCNQAEIHEIIMNVEERAKWEPKLRQRNHPTKENGSRSWPIHKDEDHTSIRFASCEPSDAAPSPTPTASPFILQKTPALQAEDGDREKSAFLEAEAVLIKGYLRDPKKLHVRITGTPSSLASNHNKAG